jgi:hypothetical protein
MADPRFGGMRFGGNRFGGYKTGTQIQQENMDENTRQILETPGIMALLNKALTGGNRDPRRTPIGGLMRPNVTSEDMRTMRAESLQPEFYDPRSPSQLPSALASNPFHTPQITPPVPSETAAMPTDAGQWRTEGKDDLWPQVEAPSQGQPGMVEDRYAAAPQPGLEQALNPQRPEPNWFDRAARNPLFILGASMMANNDKNPFAAGGQGLLNAAKVREEQARYDSEATRKERKLASEEKYFTEIPRLKEEELKGKDRRYEAEAKNRKERNEQIQKDNELTAKLRARQLATEERRLEVEAQNKAIKLAKDEFKVEMESLMKEGLDPLSKEFKTRASKINKETQTRTLEYIKEFTMKSRAPMSFDAFGSGPQPYQGDITLPE